MLSEWTISLDGIKIRVSRAESVLPMGKSATEALRDSSVAGFAWTHAGPARQALSFCGVETINPLPQNDRDEVFIFPKNKKDNGCCC